MLASSVAYLTIVRSKHVHPACRSSGHDPMPAVAASEPRLIPQRIGSISLSFLNKYCYTDASGGNSRAYSRAQAEQRVATVAAA